MNEDRQGYLSYKDLQAQNAGYTLDDYKKYVANKLLGDLRNIKSSYPLQGGVPMRSPLMEASNDEDWLGRSTYDQDIYQQNEIDNPMDIRAENQPWIAKVGAGLAKGALTFGTTWLNGNVGLIAALAQGAANLFDEDSSTNFLTGFVDNPYLNAASEISKWGEKVFPNYYSTEELTNDQNGQWWKNFASGNFIGDKILKNAGFTIGALYSGAGISAGLARILPNASGFIRGAVTTALNAVNEASIDANNNMNDDWLIKGNAQIDELDNQFMEQLNEKYAPLMNQIEAEYEVNRGKNLVYNKETGQGIDPAYAKFTNDMNSLKMAIQTEMNEHKAKSDAARQKLADTRLKVATEDFLNQLPVLLASEGFQWGRMFANGFKTANRTSHLINKNTLKDYLRGAETQKTAQWLAQQSKAVQRAYGIGKGALRGLAEAKEEVGQKVAYEVPKAYYMSDVMNFYKASMDPEAEEETMTRVNAFRDGFKNTFNDPSWSEEAVLGFIPGAFGVPVFGKRFTSSNETWLGQNKIIGVTGGIGGAIKENNARLAQEKIVMDEINKRVQSPDFINYWQGLIRHQKYQTEMDAAVNEGNKAKFEDANQAQMISDITMFDNAGKLEELIDLVSSITDESEQNIADILKETTQKLSENEAYKNKLQELQKERKSLDTKFNRSYNSVDNKSLFKESTVEKQQKLLERIAEIDQEIAELTANANKTIGAFVDENGNAYDKEYIKGKIKENKEDLLNTIKLYRDNKREIDSLSENKLNTEQLSHLTWLKTHTQKWQERLKTMVDYVQINAVRPAIEYYQSVLEKELQDKEKNKVTEETENEKVLNEVLKDLRTLANSNAITFALQDGFKGLPLLLSNNGLLNQLSSESIKGIVDTINDIPSVTNLSTLYNLKFVEYMADKNKLVKDMDKAKEEIKDSQGNKKKKERSKKIQAVADRIRWESSLSDIANDIKANQNDIDELGGLDTFRNGLSKDQKKLFDKAVDTDTANNTMRKVVEDADLDNRTKRLILAEFDKHLLNGVNVQEALTLTKQSIDRGLLKNEDVSGELSKELRVANEREEEQAVKTINRVLKLVEDNESRINNLKGADVEEKDTEDKKVEVVEDEENEGAFIKVEDGPSKEESTVQNIRVSSPLQEGRGKEFLKPLITEVYMHGFGEKYSVYIEEHEEAIPDGVDIEAYKNYIRVIENYLEREGAFEYVKHKLKVNDELEFVIDESLNEEAKQTIVLIRVKGNKQIVGSLPTEMNFNSRSKVPKKTSNGDYIDSNGKTVKVLENTTKLSYEVNKKTYAENNPIKKKLYDTIIAKYNKNKKEGKHTEDTVYFSSKVESLRNGRLPLSTTNLPLSNIFTRETPNIAYLKNGEFVTGNTSINTDDIISPSGLKMSDGQVYVLIPTNNGKYLPALLYSTNLKELDEQDEYMQELIEEIKKSGESLFLLDERDDYKKHLSKLLRSPYNLSIKYVTDNRKKEATNLSEAAFLQLGFATADRSEGGGVEYIPLNDDKTLDDKVIFNKIQSLVKKAESRSGRPITTGVDGTRIGNKDYNNFISAYLYANISDTHSVNDFFTWSQPQPKDSELKKEERSSSNSNEASSNQIPGSNNKSTTIPEELRKSDTNNNKENKSVLDRMRNGEKKSDSYTLTGKTRSFLKVDDVRNEPTVSEKFLYQDMERLKRMLPQVSSSDRLILVDRMINVVDTNGNAIEAYGMYINGILYISKNSPLGTLYHEGFHYTVDMLLTNLEKSLMFNEARRKFNTENDLETEEILAEKFRKYMNDIYDTSITGRIKRFFYKIKHLINVITGNRDVIDTIFYDIVSNRMAGRKERKENNVDYLNDLIQYKRTKTSYDNLDEATKKYLEQRHTSKEAYNNLSVRQREYLLHCM